MHKNKYGKRRILAMDLSLNLPACCVAEVEDGIFRIIEVVHVDHKSKTKWTTAQKLQSTATMIRNLVHKYGEFDVVVREKGFSRFANTTQLLFRVVGVVDFLMYEYCGVKSIVEYPPTTIKSMIAGYSRADKMEVEEGVRNLLTEEQKDFDFYSDDESDSVAVALTHCLKQGWLN